MFFDRFTQRLFPTKWGNKVSKWLNNLVGDGYIKVYSTDSPSPENPPRIRLDFETLVASLQNAGIGGAVQPNAYPEGSDAAEKLANAQALAELAPKSDAIVNDVETPGNTKQDIADAAIARIGTSGNAARADHVHPSPIRSTITDGLTTAQMSVLASHAPASPEIVSSSETDAHKVSRMGTSIFAAREDHVHPVPNDSTTPGELVCGWRNSDGVDAGTTPKTDTWARDTATHGVVLKVVTRTWSNRGDVFVLWRELTFDRYGALVSVGAESFGDYCMGGY